MVIVILVQVFFRYVLNNALPWPDELARFLMLWMTGFIAPSAYRWGGFVSIEMLPQLLPKLIENMLIIFFNINSIFTKIRRKIPTGSDIYIQASFIDFCSPPIKSRGTFKDDELKIQPIFMCCKPN